ncbi:uncharacterized protein METZ01_LOCUS253086, partial [marine metagenome]
VVYLAVTGSAFCLDTAKLVSSDRRQYPTNSAHHQLQFPSAKPPRFNVARGGSPMAYDENNIFAQILRGEADAFHVYENDSCLAFLDVM